jgi:hypothetical protein
MDCCKVSQCLVCAFNVRAVRVRSGAPPLSNQCWKVRQAIYLQTLDGDDMMMVVVVAAQQQKPVHRKTHEHR